MATRVIYAATLLSADYVAATNTTYATAQAMTATLSTGFGVTGGQRFSSPNYICFNSFFEFNTVNIIGVATATISLYCTSDQSTTNSTLEIREYDYGGGSPTAGDAISGTVFGGQPLVASISTASITVSAYNDFTDIDLSPSLNPQGYSRFVISSDRFRLGTTPTNDEHVVFQSHQTATSFAAKLTTTDTSTQNSQTISAGTTSFTPTVLGPHDVACWGGGAKPAAATSQEAGAGGGTYGWGQYDVTSLSSITVSVGSTQTASNSGGFDTTFVDETVVAAAGAQVLNAATNGLSATIKFSGGAGRAAQGGGGSRGGSGGGSSAGTAAAGVQGTAGSGSTAGTGGTAPTGGGNGGNGGAGGGGAGTSGTTPGGGAGGGGNSGNAGDGAAGRIIVYWYVYPDTRVPFRQANFQPHMMFR